MCDELTEAEDEVYLDRLRLSRREAGIGAGATLAAVLTGCASTTPAKPATPTPASEPGATPSQARAQTQSTTTRRVTIATPDGEADAFVAAPSGGRHPGVLLWPDVAGLRDAYEAMAIRLAGEGYVVLVVNPYYRSARAPVLSSFSEWRTEQGKAKIQPLRDALTPEAIARDGAAFAAWLDRQPEVDTDQPLATTGYCMGGPFTFRTAAAVPARFSVIASFHGGGLVTSEPTSPHALLPTLKIAALICIAQNDDEREPNVKTTLQRAMAEANIPAEIEVYPAQHGWCTPDSPVYDEVQAERAWARLLAILNGRGARDPSGARRHHGARMRTIRAALATRTPFEGS